MEGPRSCAGQALAVMNLTAMLAMLYGSFTFRLADEVCSLLPNDTILLHVWAAARTWPSREHIRASKIGPDNLWALLTLLNLQQSAECDDQRR